MPRVNGMGGGPHRVGGRGGPARAASGRAFPAALSLVLVVGALAFPTGGSAQWVLGVQGGLAAYSVGGDQPEDADYGRQGRFSAGLVIARHLSPAFRLRFEPGLVQKGTAVAFDVPGLAEPVDSLALDLDYLSLPVIAQVFTPGGRGFATAGVGVGILTSATLTAAGGPSQDTKDLLEPVDVSLVFGAGGLVLRGQPLLSLEVRYEQSLTKAPASEVSSLPEGFRSSGFQLLAGLAWTVGGGP